MKGTIFISGYWPPTNIEQPDGMLNQFKSATTGDKGEYIIENFNGTGYKLVTIATTFPGKGAYVPGQEKNWEGGAGSWQVDYMLTSETFWTLMKRYSPIAVMTTSRNTNDKKWVMEIGAKNLPRASWALLAWNVGRPPYIGGAANDPAKPDGPNAGQAPKPGDPPDATRDQNTVINVTADVAGLQTTIIDALNAHFAVNVLRAEKDTEVQGIAPDNYVSAFAGYHAVWYDAWKASCKAGWHTHVGYDLTVATASTAIRMQLDELIKWLNAH